MKETFKIRVYNSGEWETLKEDINYDSIYELYKLIRYFHPIVTLLSSSKDIIKIQTN